MFLKFLISLLKKYLLTAVSFITASHTLTKRVLHSILSLKLRLSFLKIAFLQETFVSRITTFKITAIQSVKPISLMKMRSEKNQYLLRYSLPHYRALYCAAFIRHLQSQHPVSTFGIEKVCGSMKTLSVIPKMLVSPADFSTRPEGRALWEESLVLSKIHS